MVSWQPCSRTCNTFDSSRSLSTKGITSETNMFTLRLSLVSIYWGHRSWAHRSTTVISQSDKAIKHDKMARLVFTTLIIVTHDRAIADLLKSGYQHHSSRTHVHCWVKSSMAILQLRSKPWVHNQWHNCTCITRHTWIVQADNDYSWHWTTINHKCTSMAHHGQPNSQATSRQWLLVVMDNNQS